MTRIFATLCLVLLTIRVCLANSAIVLISPSAAGPDVRPETYSHPLWVTWPKATDGSGVNQLLSVVTRQVLNVKETDFVFQARPDGSFTNRAQESLAKFGLPSTMFTLDNLYAVRSGNSAIDQRLLAMASCEVVGPRVADKVEPKGNRIYAMKANSWDDVVSYSSKIDGDTVVLEFPPLAGHLWSRMWLYRSGKIKPNLPFGVMASTSVGVLVEQQSPFERSHIFDPGNSAKSGAPDRWLMVGEYGQAITVSLFSFLWVAIFWSLGFLSQEVSNLTSRLAFYLAISLCFAIKLFPVFCLWTGIQLWWFWLIFLTGVVLVAFCVADINGKEGGIPPLIRVGLPICFIAGFIRPELSPFGPVYGNDGGLKFFNAGFELALGTYFLLWSHRKSGLWWLACLSALPVMGLQSALFSSSSVSAVYFASFLAFIVYTKPLKYWIAFCLLLLALGAVGMHDGIYWWPTIDFDYLHRDRTNYFVVVTQLMRPEFGIGLLSSVCAVAFASRFEFYRLTRTWKESKIVAPLFWGCFFILIWTIGDPNVFGALPWAGTFAYLLWSQEALGKL